jgi:predicted class III extradiol MEMO1 family dioxygenase
VRGYLEQAAPGAGEKAPPKALIVPHAGYVYSGPIAASAYALLGKYHFDMRSSTIPRPIILPSSKYPAFLRTTGSRHRSRTSLHVFTIP